LILSYESSIENINLHTNEMWKEELNNFNKECELIYNKKE